MSILRNLERLVKKARGKDVPELSEFKFDPVIMEFIGAGADFVEKGIMAILKAKEDEFRNALVSGMIEFLNSIELVNQELAKDVAEKYAEQAMARLKMIVMEVFD
jgi:hypothetical protein